MKNSSTSPTSRCRSSPDKRSDERIDTTGNLPALSTSDSNKTISLLFGVQQVLKNQIVVYNKVVVSKQNNIELRREFNENFVIHLRWK